MMKSGGGIPTAERGMLKLKNVELAVQIKSNILFCSRRYKINEKALRETQTLRARWL